MEGEKAVSVNRAAMLEAAKSVAPVVPRRGPFAGFVRVAVDADGVQVHGTDGDVHVVATVPAADTAPASGSVLVQHRHLVHVLRSTPGPVIPVGVTAGGVLVGTSTLEVWAADSFPAVVDGDAASDAPVAVGVSDAVERLLFRAPADERPITSQTQVTADGDGLTLVRTDGHRLAAVRCAWAAGSQKERRTVVLSDRVLHALAALPPRARAHVAVTETGVFIESERVESGRPRVTIAARAVADAYPRWDYILDRHRPHRLTAPLAAFRTTVDRVAGITPRDTDGARKVRLLLGPTGCRVASATATASPEPVPDAIWRGGQEMSILFNAQYLLDGLPKKGAVVEMCVEDHKSAVLIRPHTDAGWFYLLMPMRDTTEGGR